MKTNNTIGVRFKLQPIYASHIDLILNNINYDMYDWYVSDSEILYRNEETGMSDCSIFVNGVYSGDTFKNIISNNVYYIICTRIFAVPVGKKINVDKIVDYDSYIKSDCAIALLSADNYMDVYVKDNNILKAINKLCYNNSYESFFEIIEGNDDRTSFIV